MSFEVDLSNCDREPIHIPGSIQPHGLLFTLEPGDLKIRQISENASLLVGRPPEALLDTSLSDILDAGSDAAIRAVLEGGLESGIQAVPVRAAGRHFEASLHRHAGVTILELEPAAPLDGLPSLEPLLRDSLVRMQSAWGENALHEEAVAAFHRLTGFDRVLLYQFGEDAHGHVVAEVRAPELEPYLGLHFPASDIPRQARELYRLNPFRLIPDVAYRPVALRPALRPDTGEPLDLSFAILRSVSPIHREYMHNMGIRASMSLSILHEGHLWGLLSCHHRTPRHVPHRARMACEVLARTVGLLNTNLISRREQARRDVATTRVERVVSKLGRGGEIVFDDLMGDGKLLCDVVGATGLAVSSGSRWRIHGRAPAPEILDGLRQHIRSRTSGGIYATNALSREWPGARSLAQVASGILAIFLPKAGRELIWFRPEVISEVRWAGNPNKPVDLGEEGRLRPRNSFVLWQQVVRGTARDWGKAERAVAAELRRRIIESDLSFQLRRAERAVRARDDVMAVVSHDLRNPLGTVSAGVDLLQARLADAVAKSDGEEAAKITARIRRSLDYMDRLISDLLDASRIDAGRFVVRPSSGALAPVVEEATAAVAPEAAANAVVLEPRVPPGLKAYLEPARIRQVLVNLLSNAIRHSPPGGVVCVECKAVRGEALITVEDAGAGIPPGQMDRLFDRFWQEGRGDTGAAGLGLYIARGIVEAHGGRIWAERRTGAGARFRFTLPMLASRTDSVQDASHEHRPPRNRL